MSPQYGELRRTNGWDRSGSLRHPCKFQRLFASWQRYCTASSGGRQPNFAALNRGRHLCSAGRPSRWALAHILVHLKSAQVWHVLTRDHTVLPATHPFIHKWNEPYLSLLPNRRGSPHFGWYSFPVQLRVGGWVDVNRLILQNTDDNATAYYRYS